MDNTSRMKYWDKRFKTLLSYPQVCGVCGESVHACESHVPGCLRGRLGGRLRGRLGGMAEAMHGLCLPAPLPDPLPVPLPALPAPSRALTDTLTH